MMGSEINSQKSEISCTNGCDMCDLCSKVEKITHSDINSRINKRIQDFRDINTSDKDVLFGEFCFCILTANFNAKRAIKIQEEWDWIF